MESKVKETVLTWSLESFFLSAHKITSIKKLTGPPISPSWRGPWDTSHVDNQEIFWLQLLPVYFLNIQ